MASEIGRGAQVLLDDDARRAARGATGGRLIDNIRTKQALEAAGMVATGDQPDGSSKSGAAAKDLVLATGGAVAGGSDFSTAFSVWFLSLPTSPPDAPNIWWNNGGTLARS